MIRVLHVTPKGDWQNIAQRAAFALAANGVDAECLQITTSSRRSLVRSIKSIQPDLIIDHAFAVSSRDIISVAGAMPGKQFLVGCHSKENALLALSNPRFFGELRWVLEGSKSLPNLTLTANRMDHWRELGYRVYQWSWPMVVTASPHLPATTTTVPRVLLTSRLDLMKALPAQVIAAALLQRRLGAKVALSLTRETDSRRQAINQLTIAAGLDVARWEWLPNTEFMRRLRNDVDIVLQPSMSETFNYITAEAGMMGRPWVGSNEIHHTPDQWKADPDNPEDIARVAEAIWADYPSASRLARQVAESVADKNNRQYADLIRQFNLDKTRKL